MCDGTLGALVIKFYNEIGVAVESQAVEDIFRVNFGISICLKVVVCTSGFVRHRLVKLVKLTLQPGWRRVHKVVAMKLPGFVSS